MNTSAHTRVLLCAATVALLFTFSAPTHAVESAAFITRLTAPDAEQFERVVNDPTVDYVLFQRIITKSGVPAAEIERVRRLAAAGKKPIVQIWWGPAHEDGFPWSKYSFANIGLEEDVRRDFFREVVDFCIDAYGAENLYGVHLLEETGMQFATDVQHRPDPWDFWNFQDNNQSYDHPFWSGWGKRPGRLHIPNVRRHESDFKRIYGFGFEGHEKWNAIQNRQLDRWISHRLQSTGQVEFAKHIHKKYPDLKAFTWDGVHFGGNTRTDMHFEATVFDGVITNPYGSVLFNFYYHRLLRRLFPNAQILCLGNGGYTGPIDRDERKRLLVGQYMSGADVIGLWSNPNDCMDADIWRTNHELYKRFEPLPRFEKTSPIAIVAPSVQDIYSVNWHVTGVKYFDPIAMWEAHAFDLYRYPVLIVHTNGVMRDHTWWQRQQLNEKHKLPGIFEADRLEQHVRDGGVLVLVGMFQWSQSSGLFVAKHLKSTAANQQRQTVTVKVDDWWRQFGIADTDGHRFDVDALPATPYPDAARFGPGGVAFFRYGKGAVLVVPFRRAYHKGEPYDSDQWRQYRRYLTALIAGTLRAADRGDVADEYLCRGDENDPRLEAVDDAARYRAIAVDKLALKDLKPRAIDGHDLIDRVDDPSLDRDHTAVLIDRRH